jgi:hypothetical protein
MISLLNHQLNLTTSQSSARGLHNSELKHVIACIIFISKQTIPNFCLSYYNCYKICIPLTTESFSCDNMAHAQVLIYIIQRHPACIAQITFSHLYDSSPVTVCSNTAACSICRTAQDLTFKIWPELDCVVKSGLSQGWIHDLFMKLLKLMNSRSG